MWRGVTKYPRCIPVNDTGGGMYLNIQGVSQSRIQVEGRVYLNIQGVSQSRIQVEGCTWISKVYPSQGYRWRDVLEYPECIPVKDTGVGVYLNIQGLSQSRTQVEGCTWISRVYPSQGYRWRDVPEYPGCIPVKDTPKLLKPPTHRQVNLNQGYFYSVEIFIEFYRFVKCRFL